MKAPSLTQSGLTLMETLIAIVVFGAGVGLFMKMQNSTWLNVRGNSSLLRAGQIVEKQVEATRMSVYRDTTRYWPPADTAYEENGISLEQTVMEARSPKDGLVLANVRKLELVASWGSHSQDTLKVWTYVSKKF